MDSAHVGLGDDRTVYDRSLFPKHMHLDEMYLTYYKKWMYLLGFNSATAKQRLYKQCIDNLPLTTIGSWNRDGSQSQFGNCC